MPAEVVNVDRKTNRIEIGYKIGVDTTLNKIYICDQDFYAFYYSGEPVLSGVKTGFLVFSEYDKQGRLLKTTECNIATKECVEEGRRGNKEFIDKYHFNNKGKRVLDIEICKNYNRQGKLCHCSAVAY